MLKLGVLVLVVLLCTDYSSGWFWGRRRRGGGERRGSASVHVTHTGAGVQGQWNAGNGWSVGGHYNHDFNGGHSGGVTISKSWKRRKRAINCVKTCVTACEHHKSPDKCLQKCVTRVC